MHPVMSVCLITGRMKLGHLIKGLSAIYPCMEPFVISK